MQDLRHKTTRLPVVPSLAEKFWFCNSYSVPFGQGDPERIGEFRKVEGNNENPARARQGYADGRGSIYVMCTPNLQITY